MEGVTRWRRLAVSGAAGEPVFHFLNVFIPEFEIDTFIEEHAIEVVEGFCKGLDSLHGIEEDFLSGIGCLLWFWKADA